MAIAIFSGTFAEWSLAVMLPFRLIVGWVLLSAGVGKLLDLPAFVSGVLEYRILRIVLILNVMVLSSCALLRTTHTAVPPALTNTPVASITSDRAVQATPSSISIDVAFMGGPPFFPFLDNQSDPMNRLVIPAIYAGLTRLDQFGNHEAVLVTEVPSLENGLIRFSGEGEHRRLEVEFQLLPDLKWQDGEPLTAEDVLFSWEYVMQPEWPGSRWAHVWLPHPEIWVSDVVIHAPDRKIFRFMSAKEARESAINGGRLEDKQFYEQFSERTVAAIPMDVVSVGRYVFPKHLLAGIPLSQLAESDFARNPVFAGPYRLDTYPGRDKPLVVTANPFFSLGKPEIEKAIFGVATDNAEDGLYWKFPENLRTAMAAGLIDAQLSLPAVRTRQLGISPAEYQSLAEDSSLDVSWIPRYHGESLDFNLDNVHLRKIEVRHAIAYALDGFGEVATSYLPATHPLHADPNALSEYPHDPEMARRLLELARYDLSVFPASSTDGKLVFELHSMDVAPHSRPIITGLIERQLAEVGIQVFTRFHEWVEFEGNDCSAVRNGRRFDLGLAGWFTSEILPLTFVERTTASCSIPNDENGCLFEYSNFSGWSDARIDELLLQIFDGERYLIDSAAYLQLWHEHQAIYMEALPSLPLFSSHRPIVYRASLVGLRPSTFRGVIDDTWNIDSWSIR